MKDWLREMCDRVMAGRGDSSDFVSPLHEEGAEAATLVSELGYCDDDFIADLIGCLIEEVERRTMERLRPGETT